MPDILIQPDNRLLNWSTNDLSLYGAQLAPGVEIGPAKERSADAVEPSGPSTNDQAAPQSAPQAPATEPSATQDSASSDPAPAATPVLAPATIISYIPPDRAAPASADDATPHIAPLDAVSFVPVHGAPSGDSAALAPNTSASPLTAPVAHIQDAATHIVTPLAEPLAALDSVTADLTELLDGVRGADPAAGIGTIVDLMRTADIFELQAATTDIVDHGVTPLIDTLAFDAIETPPLLGDADTDHDSLLGTVIDTNDGHHGLPLGL